MRMSIFAVVLISALLPAAAEAQGKCDRARLEKFVDRYLDAMAAHKASPELFARDCKFTENGARLPLGEEGLWYSMSGKGAYAFYIPDIEALSMRCPYGMNSGWSTYEQGISNQPQIVR